MTMTERAAALRLPNPSCEEDLESKWSTVIRYGNRILLAGYWYTGNEANWHGAVYEFLNDGETGPEDPIGLRDCSGVEFEDAGHAIAWCLQQD